jgi:hypothetical protein
MTSHLNLEQADEGSWRRKVIFRPGNCHTSGWRLEERGLRRSAYRVRPIRKNLVVMSQWAEIPGTWRALRQLLSGLLLWQPSQPSRKKLDEGAPLFCGRLVIELRSGETGQGQQEHIGDLSTSGLGDSKLHLLAYATMPQGLKFTHTFVPFGPVSHQAEQAALDLTVVHRQPRFQWPTLNT